MSAQKPKKKKKKKKKPGGREEERENYPTLAYIKCVATFNRSCYVPVVCLYPQKIGIHNLGQLLLPYCLLSPVMEIHDTVCAITLNRRLSTVRSHGRSAPRTSYPVK